MGGIPDQYDTTRDAIEARRLRSNAKQASFRSVGQAAGAESLLPSPAAPHGFGGPKYAARYSADFTPDQAWTVDSDTIGQWLVSDGFDGTTLVDEAGGDNDGAYRASVVAAGSRD